jgi:hypothetical protein
VVSRRSNQYWAQFLYGEGENTTLEECENLNALNTMASRLVVSVSSSLQSNFDKINYFMEHQSSYSKDVSKDVKLEVQKIKFTNAVVEKNSLDR